ncbi:MAG: hypothetical protein WC793_02185 [Candidatus Paceibacterota bacterium]|jgi:hypothetical protein
MKYKSFKIIILAVFVLLMAGTFVQKAKAIGGGSGVASVWAPSFTVNYNLSGDQNTMTYSTVGTRSGSIRVNCGAFTPFWYDNTSGYNWGGYIGGYYVDTPYLMDNGTASVVSTSVSGSISSGEIIQQTPGRAGDALCNDSRRYSYYDSDPPIDNGTQGTFITVSKSLNVSSLPSGTYTLSVTLCAENTSTSGSPNCGVRTQSFTISRAATPYTVSAAIDPASASHGTVDPTTTPRTGLASDGTATTTFKLIPDTANNYVVDTLITNVTGGNCLKDKFLADNVTYQTGPITANNCVYTFGFKLAPAGVPVVTLTANPTSGTVNVVNPGLTWSATNSPTSCTASGDWSGSKATSGTNVSQGVLTQVKTYTYNLSCSNASGTSALATATVDVIAAAPPMSGTLTASDCQITAGNNSCLSSLSWTTTNPEGVSNVTSNTPVANTVVGGPANNGTSSASVSYGTRTFFLNNNAKSLVPASESPAGSGVIATATCASGTTWNGSICISAGGMTGTLTPASSTCTISSGASTCTRILAWTTTNPVAVSAVTNADGATPNPSASNNNTSQVFTIHYNLGSPSTFYLYNNMQNLATATVTPVCTAGTTWNGTTCAPSTAMTGTLTSLTNTCTIASGASTCLNKVLSWTTTNPVATSSVSNSNGATPNPGPSANNGSQGFTIQYNNSVATTFWLYNNGVPLASKAITPVCASGSGWDGTKCLAGLCSNGANNPPTCNTCTPPATYSLLDNKCVNLGLCLNGATNPPACTTNSGGTCLNGATNPPACDNFGAGTAGVCAPTHYNCSVGTVNAASKKSNTSNFTWTCDGVSGGASSPQCLELKKKPIFIEN